MMPFFPAFIVWAQWLKKDVVFGGAVILSTLLLPCGASHSRTGFG